MAIQPGTGSSLKRSSRIFNLSSLKSDSAATTLPKIASTSSQASERALKSALTGTPFPKIASTSSQAGERALKSALTGTPFPKIASTVSVVSGRTVKDLEESALSDKMKKLFDLHARLGKHASEALQAQIDELRSISNPPPIANISKATIETKIQQIEVEVKKCIDSFCWSKIDEKTLQKFFPHIKNPLGESVVSLALKGCLSTFLRTGKTGRESIGDSEKTFKCRCRNKELQVLIQDSINMTGGTKVIIKIGLLFGQKIGSQPNIFAYAKPKSDGIRRIREIATLQKELEFSKMFSHNRDSHFLTLEPIYREKNNPNKPALKGVAMEFFDSPDASAFSKTSIYPLHREAVRSRLSIACQMSQALETLHRSRTLHGDLKGANVLLKQTGAEYSANLIDLGLSVPLGIRAHGYVGTTVYVAPEQWKGGFDSIFGSGWITSGSADMWGFGLFLLELIFGQSHNTISMNIPSHFLSLSFEERRALVCSLQKKLVATLSLDNPLHKLVINLLEIDPEKRPTAEAATATLQELMKDLSWWKET